MEEHTCGLIIPDNKRNICGKSSTWCIKGDVHVVDEAVARYEVCGQPAMQQSGTHMSRAQGAFAYLTTDYAITQ